MPTSQEDDSRLTPTPMKPTQHTPKDAECLFRATWTPVTRIYFTHENPYSPTFRWLNVSGPTLTNLNVSSFYSKELLPGNWHRPSFSVLTPRILHVLDRAVNRTSWSRWSKEQPQVLTKNSTEKKHETEETHAGICTASKYTYLSVPRRMTLVKGLKNAPWKILIKISNHRQKSKLSPSIPAPLTNHV